MINFLHNTATVLLLFASVATATPVEIRVRCNGVNFSELTLQEATTAGHVLEAAYAAVHPNDPTSLNGLVYHGHLSSTTAEQQDEEDEQQQPWLSVILGWGNKKKERKMTGQWSGTWDCNTETASEACTETDNASELAAWENELVAGLLLLPGRDVFDKVNNCKIDMQAAASDVTAEPNVNIGVHCNNKKIFDHLSVAEGTFVGKALQEAFAKVHTNAGGEEDGSHLEHTYFHSKTVADSPEEQGNLRFYCDWCRLVHIIFAFYWNGSWDCGPMCPNDDDMLLSNAMTTNHMAAWQAEFVALLNQGPKKFRGITSCEIKMEPHALTEAGSPAEEVEDVVSLLSEEEQDQAAIVQQE